MRLATMLKQGLIPFDKLSVLYVLGRFALTRTALPRDLLPFLAPEAPRFQAWSVCAFGRRETACVTAAALLGGHARVGFENNLALPNGERAASNAELVGRPPMRSKRSAFRPRPPTASGRRRRRRWAGDRVRGGPRAACIAFCAWVVKTKRKRTKPKGLSFPFLLLSFTFSEFSLFKGLQREKVKKLFSPFAPG